MKKKGDDFLPLGCFGNKSVELKLLFPIIEKNIDKDTIFVEPFCGSAVVSFNVFKNFNIKTHINDIETWRIKFYENMRDENERQILYDSEKEILLKGQDFYNSIVREKPQTFKGYILGKRIHGFRMGLFPTTTKIILREISPNWIEFFQKSLITNQDFKEILKEYKDNDKAFIYLDPPYLDSYNANYVQYQGKTCDEDYSMLDNTEMYIILLDILQNAKAKILFSINDCALTQHIYKDFIINTYNKKYQTSHKGLNFCKRNTNVLIISNCFKND